MKRDDFIRQLSTALAALSAAERDEILADYHSYFDDGIAAGRSEEDLAAGLGDPARLARELTAQRRMKAWDTRKTPFNLWRLLVALAGLGVLNAVLAVPVLIYLSILSALTCAAGIVLTCGLLLTGGWASHAVFGWPALEGVTINDSGEGPWFLGAQPPELTIHSARGDEVVIHRDPLTGSTRIVASDARGSVRVERASDGTVSRMEMTGDGNVVTLGVLKPWAGPAAVLSVGLVLLLLGVLGLGIGVWVMRLSWRGLIALARMQLEVIRGAQ
ncbi:DUF1700 domain-containing protein [Paludibacterium yongneupense]|uniref:DUF1700 domain-containing protein n=1 Tax=Paludibacterium yongneupense TaxID=400061 RepID=UPI00041A0B5D|nr:DUF1700 domain-containing protein [Paludibacterium yongneupense]